MRSAVLSSSGCDEPPPQHLPALRLGLVAPLQRITHKTCGGAGDHLRLERWTLMGIRLVDDGAVAGRDHLHVVLLSALKGDDPCKASVRLPAPGDGERLGSAGPR